MFEDLFHSRRMPVILQSEASECGLACLAMIASNHGWRTTLLELRSKYSLSLKGMTLEHLMKAADSIGFVTRPIRCELDELDQLKCPAILHWDLNHFVVLASVGRNHVTIHDPAHGKRKLHRSVVSKHFTGIALELTPSPFFEKKSTVDRVKLSDLWSRIRGLVGSLWQIFILSLVLQVAALASPLVNQIVVDEAITKNDINLLNIVIIGFALLLLFQITITALRSFIGMYLGNLMTFQMSSNLLRHLLRLPIEYFEKRHIGDVVTRFASLGPIQKLITSGLMGAALDGLMAVGTLAFMLFYAPTLTLIVMCFLAVYFTVRMVTFPYLRRLNEEQIQTSADLQSYFLETIRAVRTVKLFGREEQRHSRWQNFFADNMNLGIRLDRIGIWAGVGNGLMGGFLTLVILYLGARSVIAGEMTLGMLFAFQAYRMSFTGSVTGLINFLFAWRLVGLHLERLGDVTQTNVEESGEAPAQIPHSLRGVVRVENLRFRYADNEPWVIDGIDFEIASGERVAIVGRSGGGKTTLLKLLLGLYSPNEGRILFDGHPTSQLGRRAIRAHIGVVMQDDRLLSGSLADNIAFFDTTIDMDRVIACAKQAAVHDEIIAMPMGYQSLVGDMGSALSGGQSQRIMLARALYSQPSILILDEGTANLDHESETKILKSLSTLRVTQIIIAHRPNILGHCDRTVEMKGGKLS